MSKSLGEKIKSMRKERRMTQAALAGSEMTKSMLSQIENNLAMPSMKNLQYIASKLGKSMSYFLEDAADQNSLPVEEIHAELKAITELMRSRRYDAAALKLEAIVGKYHFDSDSKLYADLLSKHGECLIELNKSEIGEQKIREAVGLYCNKFLFIEAARAYNNLIWIPWNDFDYAKCMDILEEALQIYSNSINKDHAFEIEALQIKAWLYGGLDKLQESIDCAAQALDISKQTGIYFKADELYKNLAVMNGFLGRFDHFDQYLEKSKQYAVFVQNNDVLASIEGIYALFSNQKGNPQKALTHLDNLLRLSQSANAVSYAHTVKIKSLYMLGEYQQALDSAKLIQYPTYTPFKYDYLQIWSSKIYEGLCLYKLGQHQKALEAIKIAIAKMEVVGASNFLALAYKSISEIYSDLENYENAFAALRMSTEIAEAARASSLYY